MKEYRIDYSQYENNQEGAGALRDMYQFLTGIHSEQSEQRELVSDSVMSVGRDSDMYDSDVD
jgi:hypothetical protein